MMNWRKLWQANKDKGLVVLGVPCNQFGGQEPGSEAEIGAFCAKNYGVTFPLTTKNDVKGKTRIPSINGRASRRDLPASRNGTSTNI